MKLCRVAGTVVHTVHHPAYDGHKLLLVQPLDEGGHEAGTAYLAIDRVQAGTGDHVLVLTEGNGVRQLLGQPILPIRSVIVGIVDRVDVEGTGDAR